MGFLNKGVIEDCEDVVEFTKTRYHQLVSVIDRVNLLRISRDLQYSCFHDRRLNA